MVSDALANERSHGPEAARTIAHRNLCTLYGNVDIQGGFSMADDRQAVFTRLKAILSAYAGSFAVSAEANRYGLEAPPGPATLRAWHGQVRRTRIPVAWVEQGKAKVSFHLLALEALPSGSLSKELQAHRQGKTCFSFGRDEPTLFQELAQVTERGLAAFRAGGFIADRESA